MSRTYHAASMLQAIKCSHVAEGVCAVCQRLSDNLNYFGIALCVVSDAVAQNKAAELYALLLKWAREHLPDFPPNVDRPLYESEAEFPEIIEDAWS